MAAFSMSRTFAKQAALAAVVCAIAAALAIQAAVNLKARGIASGFGYLGRAAGFEITSGLLRYSARDTYARALVVGLCNTIRVALPAMAIASALGIAIGVARLSRIWIVAAVARVYVEIFRNTPLLLQLLFWYSLSQSLPAARDAWQLLPGVFLCVRGLYLPGVTRPVMGAFNFQGGIAVSPEF